MAVNVLISVLWDAGILGGVGLDALLVLLVCPVM